MINTATFFEHLHDSVSLGVVAVIALCGPVCITELSFALNIDLPNVLKQTEPMVKNNVISIVSVNHRRGYALSSDVPTWAIEVLNTMYKESHLYVRGPVDKLRKLRARKAEISSAQ